MKLRPFLLTILKYLSSLDLTDKLHTKEDEFASLCSELQVIKDTTLGNIRIFESYFSDSLFCLNQ